MNNFKDVEFMTAHEKQLVLKDWIRFIGALASNKCKEKPDLFSKFTKRLYQHLHLHCSFIAHYDRNGFYSTYFDDPAKTVEFIRQFDCELGSKSVEYGGNWWLNGDFEDLNREMCIAIDKYKKLLYERLRNSEKENDISVAKSLADKWGYVVK
ncbi:MAG: hypothetical protein LHV68_05145 [Elusimicrobia bacterium]|nr:hypothetical protein [Candidatus Liberimonas magnetica]